MGIGENYKLGILTPRNYQVFFLVVLCTAVIHPTVMGFDSQMISSILNLPLYKSYFELTPVTTGLNTASTWMGQILWSLCIGGALSERFGRKPSIFVGACLTIVGVCLQTAAQHIAMFVIGRIIIGAGVVCCLISASAMVSELAMVESRGLLTGLCFSCYGFGSLIASVVTYGTRDVSGTWSWRIPSLVQGIFSLVGAFCLLFITESPHFLIKGGNEEAAIEVLRLSRRLSTDEAMEAASLIKYSIKNGREEKSKGLHPFVRFCKGRGNLRRVAIYLSQSLITEMGGSSVGSYFFSILLEEAGIKNVTKKLQATIVMSLWSLVLSCVGAYSFGSLPRKVQSLVSLCGMIVSFYILGGLIKEYGSGQSLSGLYGCIAMMFIFTGFYGFTYTPLTMTLPSEISPSCERSAGITLFETFDSSFGLLSSFVLPIAMSNIGWKFYIINASYDIIFLPIIYFVWVETKGLDLAQIDAIFDGDSSELLSESNSDLVYVEEQVIGKV